MTTTIKKLSVFFTFVFVSHCYAQNILFDNAVALWGSAGYSVLTNFQSKTHPMGGPCAHLGIGWDGHFIKSGMLVQVGIECGYSGSYMGHDEWDHKARMFDTEGSLMEMYYHLHQVREYVSNGDAGLQVFMGYKSSNGPYFLLGPVIRYCFAFHATTSCEVRSTGRYYGLIGDDGMGLFGSDVPMSDHFFNNNSYRLKETYDNKLIYQFHLEVGYASPQNQHRVKHKPLYRVAAFIDAGYIPKGHTSTDADDVVNLSTTDEYKPQANAFLWRGARSGLGQLAIGAKFTLIFRHRNDKCVICKD